MDANHHHNPYIAVLISFASFLGGIVVKFYKSDLGEAISWCLENFAWFTAGIAGLAAGLRLLQDWGWIDLKKKKDANNGTKRKKPKC